MKTRIVYDELTNIKRLTLIHKDEFEWVFYAFDQDGTHGVNHDTAVMNFAVKGSSDRVLQKTGTVQGSRITFTFASADFDDADEYDYQLILTENDLTKAIAKGRLELLPKIE